MKDEPYEEWSYRNIECRLYLHKTPTSKKFAGYAMFGDEWIEMVEATDIGGEKAVARVEGEVDLAIARARMDNMMEDNKIEPITPQPTPWPAPYDPDPAPMNPGPIWLGDDETLRTSDTTYTIR